MTEAERKKRQNALAGKKKLHRRQRGGVGRGEASRLSAASRAGCEAASGVMGGACTPRGP